MKKNDELDIDIRIETPKNNPNYRYVHLTTDKNGKYYEHGRVYPNFDKMPYQVKTHEIAELIIELLEVIPR